MMEYVLIAAIAALVLSSVPLFKMLWRAFVSRPTSSEFMITVKSWDGKDVNFTVQADNEESIELFLQQLKAARYGERIVPPEPAEEEHRGQAVEVA